MLSARLAPKNGQSWKCALLLLGLAAREHILTGTADTLIVVRAAVQPVRSGAAEEIVIARSSREPVDEIRPGQVVVVVGAVDSFGSDARADS